MNILVVDVGGTHIKCLCTGRRIPRQFDSGPHISAKQAMKEVLRLTKGWRFDVVSIGYPGAVLHGRPVHEPHNLGPGWVGFDFQRAFKRPVKIINDAAMQALGSYRGGKMLFIGLGTGMGTALIVDGAVEAMELAHLPYKKGHTYEYYVGEQGLLRLGKKEWRKEVGKVIASFSAALQPDYVAIGGGNAKKLKHLRKSARIVRNANAFAGGYRLWKSQHPAVARVYSGIP